MYISHRETSEELNEIIKLANRPNKIVKIVQSQDTFFVCIRIRNDWGVPYSLVERIGPLEIKEAHQKLSNSIDTYGPNYEVVIEPASHIDKTDIKKDI